MPAFPTLITILSSERAAVPYLLGVEVLVRLLEQCADLEQLSPVSLLLGPHRLQLALQLPNVGAELLHALQTVPEVTGDRRVRGRVTGVC